MSSDRFDTPFSRLIALWVLRIFSPSLARQQFIRSANYADPDIATFLGLPDDPDPATLSTIPAMLDALQESLEAAGGASLESPADENFALVAEALSLNTAERLILTFFACREVEAPLSDTCRVVNRLIATEPDRFFSKVFNLPRNEVATAFSPGGRLTQCGLLKRKGRMAVEFLSDELGCQLLREPCDRFKILRSVGVAVPPEPVLELSDYPHLKPTLTLVLSYLKKAVAKGKKGVNILLHGEPGTGKTQLTRVIGRELALQVLEFATADTDGDPLSGEARLRTIRLAESFFRGAPGIFVFDEAEDILTPPSNPFFKERGGANLRKGWFNQLLENNHHPIFWISNSIYSLDTAFARRFDFVIEVPIPPRSQRRCILKKEASKIITPGLIERLSGVEYLAPAVVARAKDVLSSISRNIPADKRDEAFTCIIGGVLKAQGHRDPTRAAHEVLPAEVYDISYLNTPSDLGQIAAMLKQNPRARLCLYGPPGTGKTAFGHWLARQIDKPLQIERASDFLNPYVGGTEARIARAFERATEDNAVLLIDEVDSFLQNRSNAMRSWEVTQVNEMLTRIETYNGVLIASTNRLEHLDPASLRRFDLKLQFDYMKPSQIRDLLASYCRSLGVPPAASSDLALIETLETVTPGDFAAVARRHRFQPIADGAALLRAVIEECDIKHDRSRAIGF